MRYLLLAFLAFPALAQSPDKRQIAFQCDDEHCLIAKGDWKWMMEQHQKAQQLLAKRGWKST